MDVRTEILTNAVGPDPELEPEPVHPEQPHPDSNPILNQYPKCGNSEAWAAGTSWTFRTPLLSGPRVMLIVDTSI